MANETRKLERPAQAAYQSPRQQSAGRGGKGGSSQRRGKHSGAEGGAKALGGVAPARINPRMVSEIPSREPQVPAPAQDLPVLEPT